MGRPYILILSLIAITLPSLSSASDPADDHRENDIADLQAINAIRPASGPRIWKFTKGTSTLLVLGTVQPLREDLPIDTRGLEAAISMADAVLGPPGVTIEHDRGLIRGLFLWPSIRRLRFLEDGRTLRDVLPAAEYSRWNELKHRYKLSGSSIERIRPMYAAWKIYDAALKADGFQADGAISQNISRIARKQQTPVASARFTLSIEDAEQAIGSFHIDPEHDRTCFMEATSSLEAWLDRADEIGRAWAMGDIETGALRNVPPSPSRCWARLTNDAIAAGRNLDLDVLVRSQWISTLRSLASEQRVIFTTLPLTDLTHSSGMAEALMNEGFHLDAERYFGDQLPSPKNTASGN